MHFHFGLLCSTSASSSSHNDNGAVSSVRNSVMASEGMAHGVISCSHDSVLCVGMSPATTIKTNTAFKRAAYRRLCGYVL